MIVMLTKILYNLCMEKLSFKNEVDGFIIDLLQDKGLSYNVCQKALRKQDVKVNGKRIKENIKIDKGALVEVYYQQSPLKFDIVYQDDNIFVVNKHSGIEVEGKDGVAQSLNAIAVHRLDRNTTGLLLLARNKASANALLQAFKDRTITKKYLALVVGKSNLNGEYLAYLTKDSKKSIVKIYDKNVKDSVKIMTIIKTIKSDDEKSLVECTLVTGKTHQLRAHLAYLGYPIIGDGKYGKNSDNKHFKTAKQQLHCYYLKLDKLSSPLDYLNGKEFKCEARFTL